MARRPVYFPSKLDNILVETRMVDFQWHPGLSVLQKQRSVRELHAAASKELGISKILEISTKSESGLGVNLSAFSLIIPSSSGDKSYYLESVYQASKIFELGGPYLDIRHMKPIDAKRDLRLKNSGKLLGFRLSGTEWGLEPKTAFYDWLYLNTVKMSPELSTDILSYEAFTDIEFNPEKSVNCQAYSAALFSSLQSRGLLNKALSSKIDFVDLIRRYESGCTQNDSSNISLF